MTIIKEYGELAADRSDRSIVTELARKQAGRHEYFLKHHAPGFECAGSCARLLDHEVWSVTFYSNGAINGQRFLSEAEARARFTKWTTRE